MRTLSSIIVQVIRPEDHWGLTSLVDVVELGLAIVRLYVFTSQADCLLLTSEGRSLGSSVVLLSELVDLVV